MFRRLLVTGCALALAGCSEKSPGLDLGEDNTLADNAALAGGPSRGDAPAPGASAAPVFDEEAAEQAVRDQIDRDYGAYDKGGPQFEKSPQFTAAWDHAVGRDGSIEADPFCHCQDYGPLRWEIVSVVVNGDVARAVVKLDLFSKDEWTRTWIQYRLVGAKWLVDDVQSDSGSKGLKAEMNDAEEGSWNAG